MEQDKEMEQDWCRPMDRAKAIPIVRAYMRKIRDSYHDDNFITAWWHISSPVSTMLYMTVCLVDKNYSDAWIVCSMRYHNGLQVETSGNIFPSKVKERINKKGLVEDDYYELVRH